MGFIIALSGDIFAFVIIRKGWKMINHGQNKMTETVTDFKTRRFTGYCICALGVISIYVNHFVLKF